MDGLVTVERPAPEPGSGEVLVRMNAASINYRDVAIVTAGYFKGLRLPLVPLSDGAGVIERVGEGVTKWRAGDRVVLQMRPYWISGQPTRKQMALSLGGSLPGVAAELVVADQEHVVRTPAHLTDEQAATLPIAGVTAWMALSEGHVRPGQTVVVQGTGGFSVFATQFASRLGARTIVLSSSDEKLRRAQALGATHVHNYRRDPEWQNAVLALTGGEGADHVLDVGGAETIGRSIEALRPGGTITLVGFLGGSQLDFDLLSAFGKIPLLRVLSVGPRAAFEEMNAAIDAWNVEPVVDRVFPRAELREALETVAKGSHFGKVALTF
jgi:NADPH:quinone reductase-like Zn-dependent oxidoreductase